MSISYCVFGEGFNDIGRLDLDGALLQDGAYIGFVKAIRANHRFDCLKASYLKHLKLPGGREAKKHKEIIRKLNGFAKHAFFASQIAATEDADMLIIGTDIDRGREAKTSHSKRVQCLHDYRKEILLGYQAACETNAKVSAVKLIILVPLVKLESWILADERAFRSSAGFDRGRLPKPVEEMHGDTDPKRHLDKLFADRKAGPPSTTFYHTVARKTTSAVMKKICPQSYPPFVEMVLSSI